MGSEKSNTSGQTSSTYQQSPYEQGLSKVAMENAQAAQAGQQKVNNAGLSAVNQLLTGEALPGYLSSLPGGITQDTFNKSMDWSMKSMNNQLAASGAGSFLESGQSRDTGLRFGAEQALGAQQFNLQNLMQLLNLGVGGTAQVQQPINASNSMLGGLVKGTGTTTGQTNSTVTSMNPFLKSFQQGAGTSLGGGNFGSWTF
jgi:hypothetical protein